MKLEGKWPETSSKCKKKRANFVALSFRPTLLLEVSLAILYNASSLIVVEHRICLYAKTPNRAMKDVFF